MSDDSLKNRASSVLEQSRVVVTVVQVKGSAPREEGAQMVVFDKSQSGTIGGGSMEHDAVRQARSMLPMYEGGIANACTRLVRKRLEPRYDQCCGGVVVLLFELILGIGTIEKTALTLDARIAQLDSQREPYSLINLSSFESNLPNYRILVSNHEVICEDNMDQQFAQEAIQKAQELLIKQAQGQLDAKHSCELREHNGSKFWVIRLIRPKEMAITLFGAGHVGRALVRALSSYDCHIRWVDSREGIFPETVPENTQCVTTQTPAAEVGNAPPKSYFLVMTHSHSLDYEICDHILARDDVVFLGLIGSKSKALRFARQFKQQGLTAQEIAKITCPIGIEGIQSKKASAIAISVAAQLAQHHEAQQLRNMAMPKQSAIDHPSQSLNFDKVERYAE